MISARSEVDYFSASWTERYGSVITVEMYCFACRVTDGIGFRRLMNKIITAWVFISCIYRGKGLVRNLPKSLFRSSKIVVLALWVFFLMLIFIAAFFLIRIDIVIVSEKFRYRGAPTSVYFRDFRLQNFA